MGVVTVNAVVMAFPLESATESWTLDQSGVSRGGVPIQGIGRKHVERARAAQG